MKTCMACGTPLTNSDYPKVNEAGQVKVFGMEVNTPVVCRDIAACLGRVEKTNPSLLPADWRKTV